MRKNDADEMSPGTVIARGWSRSAGKTVTSFPSRATLAPIDRSIRSVWSREGSGSTTVTGESAWRAAKVRVARHDGHEGLGGEETGPDPDRGPGVPRVDDVLRLGESPHPPPVDADLRRGAFPDVDAQRDHHPYRAQGVLRGEEAPDAALPVGHRGEHHGPVADRLVPGDGDGPRYPRRFPHVSAPSRKSLGIRSPLQPVPRPLRLPEKGQQPLFVPPADEPLELREVLPVVGGRAEDLGPVLEDDVLPHLRVARGDPREVPEPPRGVPEGDPGVEGRHGMDQGVGDGVGEVGDVGEHVVVRFRVHPQHPRPRHPPQRLDAPQGRLAVPRRRGDDRRPAAEQGRVRRGVSRVLGPRDRVPADELRAGRHALLSDPDDPGLGAPDVGHHRPRPHPLPDAADDPEGPDHRHAHHDDVARRDLGFGAGPGDGAGLPRPPDGFLPSIAPPDLGRTRLPLERQGERPADEPQAHDADPLRDHAFPSFFPTAAAIPFSRATISWKASGRRDCGPSERAVSGSWWTSTMTPSAPAAMAAAASGSTRLIFPAAWLGSAITGRWERPFRTGIAETSKVFRVADSKVRTPRSQRMIFRFPSEAMYSADISHSMIVALIPRLRMTGLSRRATSVRSRKFCMFLAPIWITSAYLTTRSMSRGSMSSVATGSPVIL